METQVLGLSVDSVPCLKAWAESLGGIRYPLLSDFYPHGQVAQQFGVLRSEGYSERAVFVIDNRGVIRYVDVHDIAQQPDNEELFRVLREIDPAAAKAQPTTEAVVRPQPTDEVILYCTPWCPDCRRARVWLQERGITWTEINIARDRAAAAQVRGWANGNETTPTFNIRGRIIVDFDKAKLAEALGVRP